MSDLIDRQAAIDAINHICPVDTEYDCTLLDRVDVRYVLLDLPSAQPERKTGHWILNRSGAYCCSKCMEPCASYAMMKPRDKFCKMCGSRNEVME